MLFGGFLQSSFSPYSLNKINKFDEDEVKSSYQEYNKLKNELKDIENSIKLNESKTNSLKNFKA